MTDRKLNETIARLRKLTYSRRYDCWVDIDGNPVDSIDFTGDPRLHMPLLEEMAQDEATVAFINIYHHDDDWHGLSVHYIDGHTGQYESEHTLGPAIAEAYKAYRAWKEAEGG